LGQKEKANKTRYVGKQLRFCYFPFESRANQIKEKLCSFGGRWVFRCVRVSVSDSKRSPFVWLSAYLWSSRVVQELQITSICRKNINTAGTSA